MNPGRLIVVTIACALCGCLSSSGRLWLESGPIDMREYAKARVLILPVEVASPFRLDDGERRAIRDQVKNNLVTVYGLKVVESLDTIDDGHAYPYRRADLLRLGELYRARAVAAISVYSLSRRSGSKASSMGVRILFSDAEDSTKSWLMSREYRSNRGFDADSERFENTVMLDLRAVKERSEAGRGFFGFLKNTVGFGFLRKPDPKQPRVVINAQRDDSEIEATPATSAANLTTDRSLLQFQILADDVSGLVQTQVSNRPLQWTTTVAHQLPEEGELAPQHIDEVVLVPLAVGMNTVEFVTTNQLKIPAKHVAQITRIARESVYTLGVGISDYQHFDRNEAPTPELKQRFATAAAARSGDSSFLSDAQATQREIERGLYDVSQKVSVNDKSQGLFYFAGRVQARKDGIYLVAYDSDPDYVEVTGILATKLRKSLPQNNTVAVLDLCVTDSDIQRRLRSELPDALISFSSCTAGETRMADRLAKELDAGRPLKDALRTISKEQL